MIKQCAIIKKRKSHRQQKANGGKFINFKLEEQQYHAH